MTEEQQHPEDDMPTDHDESVEPLPDRETPLAEIVGEDNLGSEDDGDFFEAAVDDDDEDFAISGSETRRINPNQDDEETSDDSDEDESKRGSARRRNQERLEQDQPQIIRQQQEGRLALLPLAFGFIATGAILLAELFVEDLDITLPMVLVILLGALSLTNIFRFFQSGRRERGLFFIAIIFILWGIIFAIDTLTAGDFSIQENWALFISAIGVAFIITFFFERTHQVGLLAPAILLIYASAIAILTTRNIINEDIQQLVIDYGALVLTFIGFTLIPQAIQERK